MKLVECVYKSSYTRRWVNPENGDVYMDVDASTLIATCATWCPHEDAYVTSSGFVYVPRVCPELPAPPAGQAFKADAGKPRWVLLMRGCAHALASVVRVLTFAVTDVAQGGKGYTPNSWLLVPNAKERYEDALYRHLDKIHLGETHDDESKESHWAHVATNALFLAELYAKDGE
jgi:hypothetical protein